MNQTDQRQSAIGATRAEARYQNWNIDTLTAEAALDILDDLSFKSPSLVASKWYAKASKNQISLFKREWNQRRARGY